MPITGPGTVTTLPAPQWRGTPQNLAQKWISFERSQQRNRAETLPKTLRDRLKSREDDIAYMKRSLRFYSEDLATFQRELASLKERRAQATNFSPEQFKTEITSLPGFIGARFNSNGCAVIHVRLTDDPNRWLGDFEFDFSALGSSNPRIRVTQTTSGLVGLSYNFNTDSTLSGLAYTNYRLGYYMTNDERHQFDHADSAIAKIGLVMRSFKRELIRSFDFAYVEPKEPTPPNWTGVQGQDSMFSNLYEFINFRNLDEKIELKEQGFKDTQASIEHLKHEIRQFSIETRTLRAQLAELENTKGKWQAIDEAAARKRLRSITSLPGVVGVKFGQDGVPVFMVRSSVRYEGKRYDLGDYEIKMAVADYDREQLDILQVREPYTGTSPYWEPGSYSWYFCLGSRKSTIAQLLADGKFDEVMALTLDSLNSFNEGQTHRYVPSLTEIELEKPKISARKRPRRRNREEVVRAMGQAALG